MFRIIILIVGILLFQSYSIAQIRINEICSSNSESLYDEDSDTPDWIELYNYSDKPVNLSDWKISDKNDFESAWQLPDTTIESGDYFLVFASGKARYSSGYYAMNMMSVNSITNFDYYEEYRYRYFEIEGDFESTLEIKSMNNEKLWGLAGLKIQDTLSNVTTFFSTFESAKDKGGYYGYYRNDKSNVPNYIPLYGVIELPYTKVGLARKGDSIYSYYYDRLGEKYKEKSNKNFLPNKIYWGVSVSSENPDEFGQFVLNNLILNGDTVDFNNLKVHEETTSETGYDYYYNECHSDFSIKGEETVYLYKDENIVDSIITKEYASDVTEVFYNAKWGITDKSTPGRENKNSYLGRVEKPVIKYENGVVTIESEAGSDVYYTLDGSTPSKNSNLYKGQIHLNSRDELITAIAEKDYYINSYTTFKTDKSEEMKYGFPVTTLASDSINLWGEYGLFSNFAANIDLKIDARFEYKNGNTSFDENVIIKLHGNTSRQLPQKSFRVYADEMKGNGELKNIYFEDSKIKSFDQIVLRNGGTDWREALLRDAFLSIVAKKIKHQIAASYNPSLFYLNNEFYGILNLRERIEDDYISDLFGIDDESINYYEDNGDLIEGEFFAYDKYFNTILNEDFMGNNSYSKIDSLIDIENFINYTALELFGANHDWPWKNIKMFQSDEIDSRYRYIVHDVDWTMGLNDFAPWDNKIASVLSDSLNHFPQILKQFLNNKQFKHQFINTYCDLMNSVFLPNNLNHILDSLANNIRPIIPLQQQRWPESAVNWESEITEMKNFINERPFYAISFLDFELNDTSGIAKLNLTSFPNNAGGFKVNTLTIDESEWLGKYLQEVPVNITAVPMKGYKFKEWSIDSLGNSAEITISLPETINLQAIYEEVDPNVNSTNIVINEIMYNADKDKDTKDWIELYNAGSDAVNLNGWSLIDEDDSHIPYVINEEYLIQPDEYVIIARSQSDFDSFIDIDNRIFGDLDYGFGGNDLVKLLDANGFIHDTVNYDNDLPWPEGADGTGYTIELIHPSLDNNIAENWELSKSELGTAGFVNSVYDDSSKSHVYYNSDSQLNINYNDKQLSVRSNNEITGISLYDLSGKEIYLDYNINYNFIKSSFKNIPNGLYLLNVQLVDGNEETVKLIID